MSIPIPPPTARGTQFNHYPIHGLPPVRIEVQPVDEPSAADVQLAERLTAVYERAIHDEAAILNRPSADVWEMIAHEFHRPFVAALRDRNTRQVAETLNATFRTNISYGLGGGVIVHEALKTNDGNAINATLTMDYLAALAEAVGVIPYENPEQGRYGKNLYLSPDEISDKLEQRLGISIAAPRVGGYSGIPVRGGVIFASSCSHLYAAHRLTQCLDGLTPRRVCEIGGGYGGCAYYATRLGVPQYRIFDLPLINVIQGFYLSKSLPDANVVLYGEAERDDGVCVYPYWMLPKQADKSFGVVLNQDSMPEIDPRIVLDYLKEICRTASRFLSINQEGQSTSCRPDLFQNWVPELTAQVPRLKRIARHPYWIRRGYVEELYAVVI